MKSISKLKDEARRYEQREEWEKAIQAYLQVLRSADDDEIEVELPLYNRVGDLCVRLGRPEEAVRHYEQAADRYAEAGLYNNAIALCNKALRYNRDRPELIRKLGQFSAQQGFITDARRYFLDYAERQFNAGRVDEALTALEDFADVSDDAEVREMLARRMLAHGRTAGAANALQRAYTMRLQAGETERAEALRAELEALNGGSGPTAAPPRPATPDAAELPKLPEAAPERAEAAPEVPEPKAPDEPAIVDESPAQDERIETTGFEITGYEPSADEAAGIGSGGIEGLQTGSVDFGTIEPGMVEDVGITREESSFGDDMFPEGPVSSGEAFDLPLLGEDRTEEATPLPAPEIDHAPIDLGADFSFDFSSFGTLAETTETEEEPAGEFDQPVRAEGDDDGIALPTLEGDDDGIALPTLDVDDDGIALPTLDVDDDGIALPALDADEGIELPTLDDAEDEGSPLPTLDADDEGIALPTLETEAIELPTLDDDEGIALPTLGGADDDGIALPDPGDVAFDLPGLVDDLEAPDTMSAAADAPTFDGVAAEESEPAVWEQEPQLEEPPTFDTIEAHYAGATEPPVLEETDFGEAVGMPVDIPAIELPTWDTEPAPPEPEPEPLRPGSEARTAEPAETAAAADEVADGVPAFDAGGTPDAFDSAADDARDWFDAMADDEVAVEEELAAPERVPEAEPSAVVVEDVAAAQTQARDAARERAPRAPVPVPEDGFIDLGALITEDDDEETTRFRIRETAPTGDEDRDFAELLSQFKSKVNEHLPPEDAAAHYDLGLAFKEMGLIDEAIGEFQVALRAGHMRLRTYEELGQCFLMKEQYNIAEKVLTRALGMKYDDELELLGVYYHLGRTYEALGRREQARDAYERVLGMDINFGDVSTRLARL